nr:MAG TPA: hypothetical protein [Caudoviricetes sp.]
MRTARPTQGRTLASTPLPKRRCARTSASPKPPTTRKRRKWRRSG